MHQTVELTFDAGAVKSDIRLYEDADCLIPFSHAPNPQAEGTYEIGDELISSQGLTAYRLDTHLMSTEGAPFDIYGYTIFSIEDNRLYMGDDAVTPVERPIELNLESFFIRQ